MDSCEVRRLLRQKTAGGARQPQGSKPDLPLAQDGPGCSLKIFFVCRPNRKRQKPLHTGGFRMSGSGSCEWRHTVSPGLRQTS